MEAVEASRIIAHRIPELPAGDIDRIQVALSGEAMVAESVLELVLALLEKFEARLDALESGKGATWH
jgi:hypothetical protein